MYRSYILCLFCCTFYITECFYGSCWEQTQPGNRLGNILQRRRHPLEEETSSRGGDIILFSREGDIILSSRGGIVRLSGEDVRPEPTGVFGMTGFTAWPSRLHPKTTTIFIKELKNRTLAASRDHSRSLLQRSPCWWPSWIHDKETASKQD